MDPHKHTSKIRLDSFQLHSELRQGLQKAGYIEATPIQAQSLPLSLSGKDVAGQAQTGTGKTGAFAVALINRLLEQPHHPEHPNTQPRALVIAPTRELVAQIVREIELLASATQLSIVGVYGGTGYEKQRRAVAAGPDILVGTPGRLIDYFKQKVYHLKDIQCLVLDEADRMFDLGFIKDIRFLLRRCPPPTERLSMLFSATLSYRVLELAYEHMNNPESVEIAPEKVTADQVEQQCYMVANNQKIPLLVGFFQAMKPTRAIVFVNTKHEAERVWGYLTGNQIQAGVLSGDVPQNKRFRLLQQFQDGELHALVATDVAARGLHIPAVSHVFNYDLPDDPEDYVHRIGRTARAGASGFAVSLVCESYAINLPAIEEFIHTKLESEIPPAELLADVDPASRVRPPPRPPRSRRDAGRPRGNRHARRETSDQEAPESAPPAAASTEEKTKRRRRPRRRKRTADGDTSQNKAPKAPPSD